MKRIIKITLPAVLLILLLGAVCAQASSGCTVFLGEPVALDNYRDIEITYNGVEIDEENSEIINTQIFTNLSSSAVTKTAGIKVEDSYSGLTVNSLQVFIDGKKTDAVKKSGGRYVFDVDIQPESPVHIEVRYKTDSDLQNAKIIKYSMNPIMGRHVKLFRISIRLSKYDIPLVQQIWPGAYEFDGSTVSTEYFDFDVNNLTGVYVMQKETYQNLKYGDDAENAPGTAMYVYKHAKDFIDNGFPDLNYDEFCTKEDGVEYFNEWEVENLIENQIHEAAGSDDYINTDAAYSILKYSLIFQLEKDERQYKYYEYSEEAPELTGSMTLNEIRGEYCLTEQTVRRICKDAKIAPNSQNLYGTTVAIDYCESEDGKPLYVYKMKAMNWGPEEEMSFGYEPRSEYDILRSRDKSHWYDFDLHRGFKAVYVNSDIDGNKIDVTEEEVFDFVNMMNIDLYLRQVLYDVPASDVVIPEIYDDYVYYYAEKNCNAAYYSDATKDIALNYVNDFNNEYEENPIPIRKFTNPDVVNAVKVPTIAHCVGYCANIDGMNIVNFNYAYHHDGLHDIFRAVNCDVSQNMLSANAAANESVRGPIVQRVEGILSEHSSGSVQPEQTPETQPAPEEPTQPNEPEQPEVIEEPEELPTEETDKGLNAKDKTVLGIIAVLAAALAGTLAVIIIKDRRKK